MVVKIPPARILVLSLFVFTFAAVPAGAQLADVTWVESAFVNADAANDGQAGSDDAMPEPQNAALGGTGYTISGSVSFTSPGPPNATSAISGGYQSGLSFLGGTSYCRIDFELAVRQTSAPPVPAGMIPVRVIANGTADATGDAALFAVANAAFDLATQSGPLLGEQALADNSAGTGSDAFNVNTVVQIATDVVAFGSLTASANISAEVLQGGTSGSATAFVDPIIEVDDQMIPGSSASYRDHYEVEFAAGWFALGPAPTKETTWGKIKRLYAN